MYNGGRQAKRQRIVGRNNIGVDDHVAMHNEMCPCVAWEI
jgi:hypothetical protein